MDINKLPIQIVNPTKEAINNFLNSDLFFLYMERYKSYDLNNHELWYSVNRTSDNPTYYSVYKGTKYGNY